MGQGVPRIEDWTEEILDNTSITEAIDFTRRWHRGEWAIAALPRDLGAGLEIGPAPPRSLGAAVNVGPDARGVGLNEALIGTRGYVPVLAHECGHLFQPSGVGLCRSALQFGRREREAWWIAAILAVPLDAVRAVRLWGDDPSVVASQLELPRAMITMRKCLALLFDELPMERLAYPRVMLETATLAQQLWVARLADSLSDQA
jgi:hypothetical protein